MDTIAINPATLRAVASLTRQNDMRQPLHILYYTDLHIVDAVTCDIDDLDTGIVHVMDTTFPLTAEEIETAVNQVLAGKPVQTVQSDATLILDHDSKTQHVLAHITLDLGACHAMKEISVALDMILSDPDLADRLKSNSRWAEATVKSWSAKR